MSSAPEIDARILALRTQLKDLFVVFKATGYSKEVALRANQIRATLYGRNIVEFLRGTRWRPKPKPGGPTKLVSAGREPDDAELAAIVAGADALLLILSHVFYDPATETGDPEVAIRGSKQGIAEGPMRDRLAAVVAGLEAILDRRAPLVQSEGDPIRKRRWWRNEEIAMLLGMSTTTISNWCSRGVVKSLGSRKDRRIDVIDVAGYRVEEGRAE